MHSNGTALGIIHDVEPAKRTMREPGRGVRLEGAP